MLNRCKAVRVDAVPDQAHSMRRDALGSKPLGCCLGIRDDPMGKSLRQALRGALRQRRPCAQVAPITDPDRNAGEGRGGQSEDAWIQLTGVEVAR
jgi:hypothetical protein